MADRRSFHSPKLRSFFARNHGVRFQCSLILPANGLRDSSGATARRIHAVLQRASAMAEEQNLKIQKHVLRGHPARHIVKLAADLGVDLLVIGAVGRSALYERMIGSQADRIMQLAPYPVREVAAAMPQRSLRVLGQDGFNGTVARRAPIHSSGPA